MHEFHDYVDKRVGEKLAKRHIVVWYDPRAEFAGYVVELGLHSLDDLEIRDAVVGEQPVSLACYGGSFFELRQRIEPLVMGNTARPLLLYVPSVERDKQNSPLMELELGGECYQPQLRQLAREALKKNFTEGRIDELLAPDSLSYQDVAQYFQSAEGGDGPSPLRNLYEGGSGLELLARWLARTDRDTDIHDKGASSELCKLIVSLLGLNLPPATPLDQLRTRTIRFCLLGEFRDDLKCEPPSSLSAIPQVEGKDEIRRVHRLCQMLREQYEDDYRAMADEVEAAYSLANEEIAAAALGSIDTFRFEERQLLAHCEELLLGEEYEQALALILERARSFWVDDDIGRRSQWHLCRVMGELGRAEVVARRALPALSGKAPAAWVAAYAGSVYESDQLQRRLEGLAVEMAEEPEARRALAALRSKHDALVKDYAEGFSTALRDAAWSADGVLHQTSIYANQVAPRPGKVAYFFVDAMRYEMGAELKEQLAGTKGVEELQIEPALAALPSITEVGMAALLPGAEASFSVVQHGKGLAAKIGDSVLGDVTARLKYLVAQVPDMQEIRLEQLVKASDKRIKGMVAEGNLFVVRSQEIDRFGEQDSDAARVVMNLTLQNLRKALLKLGRAGVEHFVVTADHGHLFGQRREEDMRADPPGGERVDLHRRCWAGRGGAVGADFTRVTAAELGYDSDLDFIFPTGLAVFRSGGGVAFHHGSTSMQEMVVPVVTLRYRATVPAASNKAMLELVDVPTAITNRFVIVKLKLVARQLFAAGPQGVRVVMTEGQEEVGAANQVLDADFDSTSKVAILDPLKIATVGLQLTKDTAKNVVIEVRDSQTDLVLAKSSKLAVSLAI